MGKIPAKSIWHALSVCAESKHISVHSPSPRSFDEVGKLISNRCSETMLVGGDVGRALINGVWKWVLLMRWEHFATHQGFLHRQPCINPLSGLHPTVPGYWVVFLLFGRRLSDSRLYRADDLVGNGGPGCGSADDNELFIAEPRWWNDNYISGTWNETVDGDAGCDGDARH